MELKLPLQLVSRHDIIRTLRELEAIENYYIQAGLRHDQQLTMPDLSQVMQMIVAENKIDLSLEEMRQQIGYRLVHLRDNAPVIHISFAVEPNVQVVQKILFWLRKEIEPTMLLQIGIQPSIAAGCVVRTQNKYFDFSLRQHLLGRSDLLLQKLGSLV